MKFIDAMDSLEKMNRMQKQFIYILFFICGLLAIGMANESEKAPLVFERGCETKPMPGANAEVTQDEIKDFLKVALPARFNSNPEHLMYLSLDQQTSRNDEQKELGSRSMKQTVIVQDVQFDKDKILVQADRLISVGDIRSAFRFPLAVKIEREGRSLLNPYGLVLVAVDQIKDKTDKK